MKQASSQAPRELRYVIIGAGMSGILAAIKLLERGERHVVVYEKGATLGGTWRENRYPGLSCDVPAHAYTYSFAPNPDWSAYYAPGPEIQAYFQKVADDYGVSPLIRYNSEVTACRFDDETATWQLSLCDGSSLEADVVIAASGVLHHINMPEIPGLGSFAGKAFHSARWDDSAVLDGTRVGIVGGGSTGIQILSALQPRSETVVHFLRSPQWIMPVPYFTYSDDDRSEFRAHPEKIDAIRYSDEYFGNIRRFCNAISNPDGPEIAAVEAEVLRNLEESVKDPVLREKLRPDYRAACKRLIYSWCYYDHVQQPNAVVETGRIAAVEPEGVRMQDGSFHPLDVLVLATGFRADRFIRPTVVTGSQGRCLDDAWSERPCAHYAMTIPGFPNFFMLNGPGGPVGNFSLIDIAERQWGYIDQLIDQLRGGARLVDTRAEAFADYEQRRVEAARNTIFGSGCSSWYLDAQGVPASWPWSYDHFAEAMETPDLSSYSFAV